MLTDRPLSWRRVQVYPEMFAQPCRRTAVGDCRDETVIAQYLRGKRMLTQGNPARVIDSLCLESIRRIRENAPYD
ncbi:hypothetical protein SDC9_128588 [bioreactor metagenome]|uniref:Uncharacterized protein n=1 Tax=bioreactor metagenome TaxID=1076179 RepID=A0A645CX74_9ZZZZ